MPAVAWLVEDACQASPAFLPRSCLGSWACDHVLTLDIADLAASLGAGGRWKEPAGQCGLLCASSYVPLSISFQESRESVLSSLPVSLLHLCPSSSSSFFLTYGGAPLPGTEGVRARAGQSGAGPPSEPRPRRPPSLRAESGALLFLPTPRLGARGSVDTGIFLVSRAEFNTLPVLENHNARLPKNTLVET